MTGHDALRTTDSATDPEEHPLDSGSSVRPDQQQVGLDVDRELEDLLPGATCGQVLDDSPRER